MIHTGTPARRGEPRGRGPLGDAPPAPAGAAAVFGGRLALAQRYAGWLAGPGIDRGLLGPREVPRLWDRHLLNCAVAAEGLPHRATVCDVGAGAGLPGIPMVLARPDLQMVLLEPLLRRVEFLTEVVGDLGLDQVTVRRGRAEELAGRLTFDVVTARAVAPLDRLAAWGLPLLRPGGVLVAIKGATAQAEAARAAPALRRLGVIDLAVEPAGQTVLSEPTWIVRVRAGDAAVRPVTRRPRGSAARRPH